jgi:hypothetical protein
MTNSAEKAEGTTPERSYEKMTAQQLSMAIKEGLFTLAKKDQDLEKAGISVKQLLTGIKTRLDSLKTRFPKNPDLLALESVYDDLQGDYDRHEETEIDSGFESILQKLASAMKEKNVRVETPDAKNALSGIISKLKNMGINPIFTVLNENPNAKTVVLFMQIHPNPGMTREDMEAVGVLKSQAEIKSSIKNMVKGGLAKNVFWEGFPAGNPTSTTVAGKTTNLYGYEDIALLKMAISELDGKVSKHRITSHNIFLASNVARVLENNSDRVSILVIGASHADALPPALAYYGANVIVVDSASKYGTRSLSNDALAKVQSEMAKFSKKL